MPSYLYECLQYHHDPSKKVQWLDNEVAIKVSYFRELCLEERAVCITHSIMLSSLPDHQGKIDLLWLDEQLMRFCTL